MAFDQNITYRVNVDDTNFQAKLTQMRASMDSSMGGTSAGGFSGNMMYGMMGAMGGGGGYGGGGMADFGSQIRPITYTPPSIAMQPHFGMFQVQQTLAQAGLASMGGPVGAAIGGAVTNYRTGGFTGMLNGPNAVPNNVTVADYMAMSSRGFGDRVGDTAAIAGVTALSTGMGLLGSAAGGMAGASILAGGLVGPSAIAGASMFSAIGLGSLAGGLMGGAAVGAYTGQVTDMMAENRGIQSALASGSFRFFNGVPGETDKLTGRGMNRRSRADTAGAIQGMEMQDLRFGADDYKQILEGGMQFDLFSGTHDTSDFKNKFKGLVETLKTVTATMHTSLKEGLEVMRGFRDMGVTDPSEVSRLTMGSEMRGRMSGRTGMEMMAIGQTGAEIFRGTGVNMERGFELNQMNAVSVRSMLNSGAISRDTVGQAGGENSLAQQMTASALSTFQSAQGRAAMMANFNPGTGTMNSNMMGKLAGGDLMSQIAGASAMGPGALLTFQARQEDLISQMSPQQMQMMGLTMDVGVAKTLRQSVPGLGMEDAIKVAGQMAGRSKAVIDTQLGMLHQDPEQMRGEQQAAVENIRAQAGMEDFRNRFNLGKRISNAWRSGVVAPVANRFINLSTEIGEGIENISLGLTGAAAVDTGIVNSRTISDSAGVGMTRSGAAIDVSGDGFAQRHWGQTGQAMIDRVAGSGGGHRFGSMEDAQAFAAKNGDTQIGKDSSGNIIGVTQKEVNAMASEARSWQSTQSERDEVGKATLSDKVGAQLVNKDMSSGDVLGVVGVANKDMGLPETEFQKKYGHAKGYYSALASRYLNEYGASASTKKSLAEKSDSSIYADSTAAMASHASHDAQEAAGSLISGVGSMDSSESRNYFINHPGDLSVLYDPNMSADEKTAKLNRASGRDMSGAVSNAQSHRSKETDALVKRIQTDIQIAASAQKSDAGGGSAGGAVMGDLSKETTKLLETQSAQLLANYHALIALQKQLNLAMGKGG